MPEISFVQGGVIRGAGAAAGASSAATTITANASANTKGSATELIAATEFDASWMLVQFNSASAAASYLVDIMIGAATEQPIAPDLYVPISVANTGGCPYLFPIFVPKGSRLSAKCQCSTGGATIQVSVTLIAGTLLGGGHPPSWISAYGATASSLGTNIDPGAVANTDSAWVEIASATDRAHNWLCVAGRFGDLTLNSTQRWRLSLGINAATEQVLLPDLHFCGELTQDHPQGSVICVPCFVPSGTRLTARVRASSTTDGDRDVNVKIYGAG